MQQAPQRQARVDLNTNREQLHYFTIFHFFAVVALAASAFLKPLLPGAAPVPMAFRPPASGCFETKGTAIAADSRLPHKSVTESLRYGSKQRCVGMRRWQQSRCFGDALWDWHPRSQANHKVTSSASDRIARPMP